MIGISDKPKKSLRPTSNIVLKLLCTPLVDELLTWIWNHAIAIGTIIMKIFFNHEHWKHFQCFHRNICTVVINVLLILTRFPYLSRFLPSFCPSTGRLVVWAQFFCCCYFTQCFAEALCFVYLHLTTLTHFYYVLKLSLWMFSFFIHISWYRFQSQKSFRHLYIPGFYFGFKTLNIRRARNDSNYISLFDCIQWPMIERMTYYIQPCFHFTIQFIWRFLFLF